MSNIKKLTFGSIVLLTINSIIGTGIFLSPGGVAKSVGSLAPWIYLIAAVFTIFLAVTFAACAKYVTKSGAAYAYAKAAFGENVGFYVGITRIVAASIAWGVMASAVIKSTYNIFSIEANFKNVTIGFIILMFILFVINFMGTKILSLISDLSTIGKMTALILTILSGILIVVFLSGNHISEIDTFVVAETKELLVKPLNTTILVSAIISAFYAFTGFESIASGSEDMEEPEKNLVRAIPTAIIIIALIYFGIILVSMFINPVGLATSKNPVVLASVFENYFNGYLSKIIVAGAIVSMFGINVAASFHTPRVLEAMAKEKHVPQIFKVRLSNGLPIFSFLLTGAIAVIIPMAFSYSMNDIIIISSISRFVQFIIVPLALISFFFGFNKEKVLNAKKNFITDVIFPIFAFILTIILLAKFDWVGKFSKTIDDVKVANTWAIVAMIIGYVVLPLLLFIYKETRKDK